MPCPDHCNNSGKARTQAAESQRPKHLRTLLKSTSGLHVIRHPNLTQAAKGERAYVYSLPRPQQRPQSRPFSTVARAASASRLSPILDASEWKHDTITDGMNGTTITGLSRLPVLEPKPLINSGADFLPPTKHSQTTAIQRKIPDPGYHNSEDSDTTNAHGGTTERQSLPELSHTSTRPTDP